MNSELLVVILTDNFWLYRGLSALMRDITCLQLCFNHCSLPDSIKGADRILVIIDSHIIFRGDWSALNEIRTARSDATLIWLTGKVTGWVFPKEILGSRTVSIKQTLASLRHELNQILQCPESQGERAEGIYLTHTESRLLPYFVSDLHINEIALLIEIPVKTLYAHRQNILNKTGLRQPSFLRFVYERNKGLPGIQEGFMSTGISEAVS